jgi:outer membrane lipoprotein-sorting protein
MKSTTIAGFLLLGMLSLARSEETDPKAILQKSVDATSHLKSFKAEMVTENFASLRTNKSIIYQKQINGSIAVRLEDLPAANNSTNDVSSYVLFTTNGVYSVSGNESIQLKIPKFLENYLSLAGYENTNILKHNANEYSVSDGSTDGKECWIVTIRIPEKVQNEIKKGLSKSDVKTLLDKSKTSPNAIPILSTIKNYIEKSDFLTIRCDKLDNKGQVINSISINNINKNIELPDSLFSLPAKH